MAAAMPTINVPPSSGGIAPVIVRPTNSGGASGSGGITVPSFVGPRGPEGPAGTRSTDIGFTYPNVLPDILGTFPITKPTTIIPSLCMADATGTGVVSFDLDGTPIGSVSFPSGVFTITLTTMARGYLNFTSTGSLSDLSIAIAGERS